MTNQEKLQNYISETIRIANTQSASMRQAYLDRSANHLIRFIDQMMGTDSLPAHLEGIAAHDLTYAAERIRNPALGAHYEPEISSPLCDEQETQTDASHWFNRVQPV